MNIKSVCIVAAGLAFATAPLAQTTGTETGDATAAVADTEALLTQTELESLVAPVALYPDTLLMQILIAATAPLDVIKADNFLQSNPDADPDALKQEIEATDWDMSVQVLATAFPDVIGDMADNIEWTETMGDAMLVQSDDVMSAIQTMRQSAINNQVLVSGEQQTVEVTRDETTQAETIIIQPTNPEVVYVPQYDHNTVFSDVGGVLLTGAMIWGTVSIIDEIFDDDDDWNNYWGCRNCGGWNGQPIIRNPNIDIDVDGNVNIGNRVDIDRDKIAWKPDNSRQIQAKQRIERNRNESGNTKLKIDKRPSRQDELRSSIGNRTGTRDISRRTDRDRAGNLPQVDRPSKVSPDRKADAVRKTKSGDRGVRSSATRKPSASKPIAKSGSGPKKPAKSAAPAKRNSALNKTAPAKNTKAASRRGNKGGSAQIKRRR
ncbi:DUF3300 domain-containing protein [Defluviimonas sp. WL0024]|uniref:DUF3300 domain-containing protein n=1 Tax=Albidovulum salinarum TaxID=2984153 RepID=A0ABT2X2K3_9RHOB|nr:DUF3300 domain-containing protein [Defluviimonas sp. WL0024]MCU9848175.1 DUF3300 domain-containing protein [Defluviimonas sp. WL0024]